MFKKIPTLSCQILIVIFTITYAPGLQPDIDFEPITLIDVPLKGPLAVNTKLNNAERLFENELKGPEDFAVFNNELYTSCHGGVIYKIAKGKLIPVIKTGKDCAGVYQEHLCGRPLGLKFDKLGSLYIADAYYGLLKANISTGEIKTLVSMDQEIDGYRPMIPNSLDIDGDIIYWTDSSTTHHLYDGMYTFFGNGRGRVLKYNMSQNKNEVLMRNINFANGIILSKDKSFLVISETISARLLRYYLKGPKAGTSDVFVDNLPGLPDNILPFGENFIVSLVIPMDSNMIFVQKHPLLKKFVARSLNIIESCFKLMNFFVESTIIEKIIHKLGHFELMEVLKPYTNPLAISVIVDNNGKIVGSVQANDRNVSSISALIQFKNHYYLGSPFNPYIGRVRVQ